MGDVVELPNVHTTERNDILQSLITTIQQQATGIKMLIDIAAQLDSRVKRLELEERKRERSAAKIIRVNREAVQ